MTPPTGIGTEIRACLAGRLQEGLSAPEYRGAGRCRSRVELVVVGFATVGRRAWLAVGVAILMMLTSMGARAAAGAPPAPPGFGDADGIHVISVRRIGIRQYAASIRPAALGRPVSVRVLLPRRYFEDPRVRYPTLYLFHGTSGRASDWVDMGRAEQTTESLPVIVVMPDAGFDGDGGGWFTNWVDTHTPLGPSQWETFHVDQLIPWVDANLRTIAARRGRAIAGLSQGGFGSISYAARHPDLFISAASFSGAPDIDFNPGVAAGATAVIQATAVGLDGVEPDAMFGSRVSDEINWQGHDPADLVTNLRGMDLWLYTASGAPGPYDPTPANPGAVGIEGLTHASTVSFEQRAQQRAVPIHVEDYGAGTHSWPYWARDLRRYAVPLMHAFAHPLPPPARTSYRSVDKSWSQWGWSVTAHRTADQQFSSLDDAGPAGFTLAGSGVAEVVTPPFYRPGAVGSVTMSGPRPSTTTRVMADTGGRLHLTVPLSSGPVEAANPNAAAVGLPDVPPPAGTVTATITGL